MKTKGTMLLCSFCNKPSNEVRTLIAAPDACICNECVKVCVGIIEKEKEVIESPPPSNVTSLPSVSTFSTHANDR